MKRPLPDNICRLISGILIFSMMTTAALAGRYPIPTVPDPEIQLERLKGSAPNESSRLPDIDVRGGFRYLLNAMQRDFLTPQQVELVLKRFRKSVITDPAAGQHFGNVHMGGIRNGWDNAGLETTDGNNVFFSVRAAVLIKLLYDEKLTPEARKDLDWFLDFTLNGMRSLPVKVSYTNIHLMKTWDLVAVGQIYGRADVLEEGRDCFRQWFSLTAKSGVREFDSPTYAGVNLESLALLRKYSTDAEIKQMAETAIDFILTDLCSHYNPLAKSLNGAHSRDYNRPFARDLLEEYFLIPLLGGKNRNNDLFGQLCFISLQEKGLTDQQKELMDRKNRLIYQRWDGLPGAYTCDFRGNKFSMATSNRTYGPEDKSFVVYLSSPRVPDMLNINYIMEGRDDHYGTEWNGDKMKHLMPPNYPKNGGWNKSRHLMYFMQAAQNKGEFVMLAAGKKDHNCVKDYLNSTILLPDAFDEIRFGHLTIAAPEVGGEVSFDETNSFFARFEDVAVAIRVLWDDAEPGTKMTLHNDGYRYVPHREHFEMANNKGLRLTLRQSTSAAIAMWWKVEEDINSEAAFTDFTNKVLDTPIEVKADGGVIEVAVHTQSGKLGVKADLIGQQRLEYDNPSPVPKDFLLLVDGMELGKPILQKHR